MLRVIALPIVASLLGCISESDRLDAEAKRLCSIDGGIKVYETVMLSKDKFFDNGMPMLPSTRDEKNWGYYSTYHQTNLKQNFEVPTLTRNEYFILRTSDLKVIASSVVYRRSGGGLLDGYLHPSGFHCPSDEVNTSFYKQVFIQDTKR